MSTAMAALRRIDRDESSVRIGRNGGADRLRAARGLALGVVLAAAFWAVLAAILAFAFGWLA